jgi:integrase
LDGKRRQKQVSSKDRNTAMAKLKKLRAEVEAGTIATSASTTVCKWLDYWLSIKKPDLAPGTYKSYANTVRLYLKPHLGAKRIDRLTAADVRSMIETLKRTPTKQSPNGSTRNAQKADMVLRMALSAAVIEGVLSRNVTAAVEKPKHLAKEGTAFSPEIAVHIIKTAESSSDITWATRWAAGFLTGVRECELLGLEWDRVDLDPDDTMPEIDVSWQLQPLQKVHGCGDPVDGVYPCGKKRYSACPKARWDFDPAFDHRLCERSQVWTRPKTKAGKRPVPLIPELVVMFRRLKAQDGPNPHNLVFHHPDGKPITQDQDQKSWRELLKAAGVPHVGQHSMRHSTATLLARAGVPEHVRMQILGQVSVKAHRGYVHVDKAEAHEAWRKLSDLLTLQIGDGTKGTDR